MPSFSSRVQLTNATTGSNIVLADVQRIKVRLRLTYHL